MKPDRSWPEPPTGWPCRPENGDADAQRWQESLGVGDLAGPAVGGGAGDGLAGNPQLRHADPREPGKQPRLMHGYAGRGRKR